MPSCGCPDIELDSGEIRSCACNPCSLGNLTECSCNKETGCACPSLSTDAEASVQACVCPPGTCSCANCACNKADPQAVATGVEKSCCS